MPSSQAPKHASTMQERLQLRVQSHKKAKQRPVKPLADQLSCLKNLTAEQIRSLTIHENGEFITCTGSKEALDSVNHIKSILRSRGFGCYALHNFIWIVPFVHESIHIPDFERAKAILPDLKADLLGKAFPEHVQNGSHLTNTSKPSILKAVQSVMGLISVLSSVLIFMVYRAMNTR